MPGPPILVTFALDEEARPFRTTVSQSHTAEILLTGIGPVSARQSLLTHFRHSLPQLVIVSGFAGGLHPEFPTGLLVCDTSLAPYLRADLLALNAQPARFHATEHVLTTPQAKAQARQQTGADVVDMESLALRDLCAEHQVPCAIVRVISDAAHESLPLDFNRYLSPQGKVLRARLVWHCLLHPTVLPRLLRLQHTTRTGAQHLATLLRKLIDRCAPHLPPTAPAHPRPSASR